MDYVSTYRHELAALLGRATLGILFFFQGFDKVFGLGLRRTEEGVEEALHLPWMPSFAVRAITVLSSLAELAGGVFLILGWHTDRALAVLAADLLVVTLGMSLRQPLWDMRFVWPRLALLVFLMCLPPGWDYYSLDRLFGENISSE
jgi:putative oxidoreductase